MSSSLVRLAAPLAALSVALSAIVVLSSCGGAVVAQAEGSGCSAYDAYTCNVEGDTILFCDSSSLWRRQAACDQGSECTIHEPEGAAASCCIVGGTETCFPEGSMPSGDGDGDESAE